MKYIKQLDSIRAIAVIMVIASHWLSNRNILHSIPLGEMGVDVFFVLSGFLITSILFQKRDEAEVTNTHKSTLVKNFYARRTLRIFPIYYLTIILLYIFADSTDTSIRSSFVYYATYTSNFHFFNIQDWDGMLSHLWSLAVEEQFYLIWPWLILFTNKKYFLPIIIGFIMVGVGSQYYLKDVRMSNILTFTCFDAFGIGAILSWILTYAKERLVKFYTVLSFFAVVAFGLIIFEVSHETWKYIPLRTLVSVVTLWIITYIVLKCETNSHRFKFILDNSILMFLGRISYGIYLFHNLIPMGLNLNLVNKYFNPLLPDILSKTYFRELFFLENIVLLIGISWLSFYFIERRFLTLKKYFE